MSVTETTGGRGTGADRGDAASPEWLAYADAALHYLVAAHHARPAGADETVGDAAAALAAARERLLRAVLEDDDGFSALVVNGRLTAHDCEILALVLACEIDARRQAIVGEVQGDPHGHRLTLHSLSMVLGSLTECAEATRPHARLRRAGLVEVAGGGTWAQLTVAPPLALVWALLGDASPDADLPAGTRAMDRDDLVAVAPDDPPHVVVVYGPDLVRRREAAMVALSGQRFLVAPQPDAERGWSALVREATMTGRSVVLDLDGPLSAEGATWIDRADHLSWAVTAPSELAIDSLPQRPLREIEASPSELSDEEWSALFGATARTHRLTPHQAERVRKIFGARGHDIDASVRRLLAGPLETLAERIRPRSTWKDLVLPPRRLEQLRSVVSRYRDANQVYDRWGFSATPSRGLVSLFVGPSGTGKTLAAEVLAGELGLDMFKLDLSSVVSKYIGETEKNLDQVFDAAGVGNVVLFFDEADALFGKRSEVRDARDRYANIEVSYLLQRVEAFDGVVVLATNFEKSIDDAFLRRIHSRIEFTLPEPAERSAIWHRHLPAGALLDDVDVEWLAESVELSGGQIRNAAVHSAFLAASEGRSIGMADLVRGTAQELRKAGRLLRPDTFGEWSPLLIE